MLATADLLMFGSAKMEYMYSVSCGNDDCSLCYPRTSPADEKNGPWMKRRPAPGHIEMLVLDLCFGRSIMWRSSWCTHNVVFLNLVYLAHSRAVSRRTKPFILP